MNVASANSPADPLTDSGGSDDVRGIQRLLRAVQELSLARTMEDIQEIVRSSARELTGCDGATFVLRDNGECYYADEDAIAPLWKGSRFPLDMCVSGWVMQHREAVVIPDIYQDSRVPHEAYRPTFVKSLVMVPIRRLDPIGAIGNYWAQQREPCDNQVDLLRALADSTSVAIENVEIYRELEQRVQRRTSELQQANEAIRLLAVTDELTGVSNRRGFYLLAESALRLARRNGHHCVLAFLDVDGLKRVNDEHGHDVGDALIADVAQILRDVLRASDIVARIGGDEFCVLVTDSSGERTTLRRRLREAFDSFNKSQNRPYVPSVSIGLIEFHASDARTVDELLACADKAMYGEKKARTASGSARETSG